MTKSDEQLRAEKTVDLRDPLLAAFLAWLIPGLGHLYQKRTAKAALFFVCIMGTFLYGLYLGSSNEKTDNGRTIGWGRVVYFCWRENDKRLPYLCQVGIGLPALPAVVQSMRINDGKEAWWGGFMAPPGSAEDPNNDQPTSHDLHLHLDHSFELGTVFTMVAGLLNVLVVYDAWGGPVFGEAAKKEEDEEDEESQEEDKKDAS